MFIDLVAVTTVMVLVVSFRVCANCFEGAHLELSISWPRSYDVEKTFKFKWL